VTKAVLSVVIGRALIADALEPLVPEAIAALAAIVGHNWSVYIRFGGGRGIACAFGAMLVLFWPSALIGLVATAALIAATRYVSLGSITGTVVGLIAAMIAVALGAEPPGLAAFALVTAALVIVQHRDNIQRLLAGTERRIGQRAEPLNPT
jgi:glycerol-3-phosphate acyltransferase PlsY